MRTQLGQSLLTLWRKCDDTARERYAVIARKLVRARFHPLQDYICADVDCQFDQYLATANTGRVLRLPTVRRQRDCQCATSDEQYITIRNRQGIHLRGHLGDLLYRGIDGI